MRRRLEPSMLAVLLILISATATSSSSSVPATKTIDVVKTVTWEVIVYTVETTPKTHIDIQTPSSTLPTIPPTTSGILSTTTSTPPVANSDELVTYSRGTATFGPEPALIMTWCDIGKPYTPATPCIVSNAAASSSATIMNTLPATTPAPLSPSSMSATTTALAPDSTTTSSVVISTEQMNMHYCLVTQRGGLQPNNQIAPGCGAMFQHITGCYESLEPWQDPYNTSQSMAFQACMCQTSASSPFTLDSVLWRNYTGCSHCLLGSANVSFASLSTELQRIENFCCSQNPVAYLFLLRLLGWIYDLGQSPVFYPPPLTGDITMIGKLGPLFTTSPPLANLAYGASAPPDDNLRGVIPSLTTYVTTGVKTTGSITSTGTATITSLVTWFHTETSSSASYDSSSAAESAAGLASEELSSALDSMASETVVAVPKQGGPTQVCQGRSSCKSSGRKTHVNMRSLAVLLLASVALIQI